MKIFVIAPRYKPGRGPPNALYFLRYIEGFKLLFYALYNYDISVIERAVGMKAIVVKNEKNHYVMQRLVKYIVENLKPDYLISVAPELMTKLNSRYLERSLVIPQGFINLIDIKFQPSRLRVATVYPELIYVARRAGAYGAISKYMYQRIKDYMRPKRIALIYNPVREQFFQLGDERIHRLKPPQKPAMLYVGRLVKEKGVHKLIQWFPNVVREYRNAELHIVGDGPLLNHLRHMVRNLGLEKKVFIHGYVDEDSLKELYKRSELLVTASYWEGFGLPVAEAAASAMPSVVREVYALKEHVELGYAIGFKEDNSEFFVEALGRALDNYEKLAYAGYVVSRRLFHPSKVAQRVLRILEALEG